ncbi:MAG: hypothetical protein ISN28_12280 [Ectothiorhodospiraceae bacterium AqS1]|nr:hypothetical protein [Ectothiorhodospiraceae bacterium AqS1]
MTDRADWNRKKPRRRKTDALSSLPALFTCRSEGEIETPFPLVIGEAPVRDESGSEGVRGEDETGLGRRDSIARPFSWAIEHFDLDERDRYPFEKIARPKNFEKKRLQEKTGEPPLADKLFEDTPLRRSDRSYEMRRTIK